MNERVTHLRQVMLEQGLEAIVITQAENRRYLSGFTGSTGVLIITPVDTLFLTDSRYYEQVGMQAPDFTLVPVTETAVKALTAEITRLGLRRVGFESHDVTVELLEQWRQALPEVEWVSANRIVEGLRRIKEPGELAIIEEAVRLADDAMAHIYEWLRPGVTERQVAWELEVYMRTHGADALSFTTIVGSGPNGARPHAATSERVLQWGDPVVIDMGAVYGGYCSDLTRSFCMGPASDEYRAVWELVRQAQEAAENAIVAGMVGSQADAVARQVITDGGHGPDFGHGLGHGVGESIHEGPYASRTSGDVLPAGTVLTVEPGIYLPGKFGVRIEDMVVVTEDGCRVLTGSAKLLSIPAR